MKEYFILRVWIPEERRYWWHELWCPRDWHGIITQADFEIWWVVEEFDPYSSVRIWPAPLNREAQQIAREVLGNAGQFDAPMSRSYRQQCRRRMRRLIRRQVGEQRKVNEWAEVVRNAVKFQKVLRETGFDTKAIGGIMQRTRRIAEHDARKFQVRLKS